jgi:hypothetical protein
MPKRGSHHLYELKYDGYRIWAVKSGAALRLFSRRALDWTKQFAVVASAAKRLPPKEFIIDGEVCALDERGIPRFQLLQDRAGQARRLAYFVFDLLWLEGEDLRRLPLEKRRDRLARVLAESPKDSCIGLSSAVPGEPRDILRIACSSGLEGIVAKEKGSPYLGGRVTTWLKIKCEGSRAARPDLARARERLTAREATMSCWRRSAFSVTSSARERVRSAMKPPARRSRDGTRSAAPSSPGLPGRKAKPRTGSRGREHGAIRADPTAIIKPCSEQNPKQSCGGGTK